MAASAFPVIVIIDNPRDNALILRSEKRNQSIQIRKSHSYELVVEAGDDWQVQYASGMKGCTGWNLDKPLSVFVEDALLYGPAQGEGEETVLVLTFTLVLDETVRTWSSYTLEGTLMQNTRIERSAFVRSLLSYKRATQPPVEEVGALTLLELPEDIASLEILAERDYRMINAVLTTLSHNSNTLSELLDFARARLRPVSPFAVVEVAPEAETDAPLAPTHETQTLAGEVLREVLANPLVPQINAQAVADVLAANINSQ